MKPAKIYALTTTLNDWQPRIWRKLLVEGNITLSHLAYVLFSSMGWSGGHLSAIIVREQWYLKINVDEPLKDGKDWNKYTLGDIVKDGLTQFQFMYDFGDGWQLTVKVKKAKKPDPNTIYPVCLDGENASPPEDVGSYVGFEHFIKVMGNKKHKDHKEMCDWYCDDDFDPTYFLAEEVNNLIQNPNDFREYATTSS